MIVQLCNIFHKLSGFEVFIDLSAHHKLGDAGNGKSKSAPAGNKQEYSEPFSRFAEWHHFSVTNSCDGDSGHEK